MGVKMERNALAKSVSSKGEAGGKILKDIFEGYASIFLPRLGNKCPKCEEFRAFFRYQLAKYLAEKPNYYLSRPEGDMVSDLILSSYEEIEKSIDDSEIPISREGRVNILLSAKIIFPWHNDTECDLE